MRFRCATPAPGLVSPGLASTLLSFLALALTTTLGCSDGNSGEEEDGPQVFIVAPLQNLTPTEASEDPIASHRPDEIDCSSLTGWYAEGERLEANTAECNYLSLSEPAAIDVEEGEILKTEISYFDLTAPEPSEAHLALLAGEELIWESRVPIPAEARIIEVAAAAPVDIPAGAPITIHLHNHGQNTWNVSPIFVER